MNGVLCAANKEETNYVIIRLLLVCLGQIKCQIKESGPQHLFNGAEATCSRQQGVGLRNAVTAGVDALLLRPSIDTTQVQDSNHLLINTHQFREVSVTDTDGFWVTMFMKRLWRPQGSKVTHFTDCSCHQYAHFVRRAPFLSQVLFLKLDHRHLPAGAF